QCRQAHPASAFFFCQALATSRMLAPLSAVRPSEDLRSSSSYCLGALADIQALASVRNAASCGVSSKFMFSILGIHFVGWVERSKTHHPSRRVVMGFAFALPILRTNPTLHSSCASGRSTRLPNTT